MSASLAIATILVTGWNLVLLTTVLLTRPQLFQSTQERPRTMAQSLRRMQAEVGAPEIDARSNKRTHDRGGGPAEPAASNTVEREWGVAMDVPYGKASVPVVGDEGEELRRCSVCLN